VRIPAMARADCMAYGVHNHGELAMKDDTSKDCASTQHLPVLLLLGSNTSHIVARLSLWDCLISLDLSTTPTTSKVWSSYRFW
jgi:hypothetical protein